MGQCRKCAYPLDQGEQLGQRCPNCGAPTREPEPEGPAILGSVFGKPAGEPGLSDSSSSAARASDSGSRLSESGAQPRRIFEVPGFKTPVTQPAAFFKAPPGKPVKLESKPGKPPEARAAPTVAPTVAGGPSPTGPGEAASAPATTGAASATGATPRPSSASVLPRGTAGRGPNESSHVAPGPSESSHVTPGPSEPSRVAPVPNESSRVAPVPNESSRVAPGPNESSRVAPGPNESSRVALTLAGPRSPGDSSSRGSSATSSGSRPIRSDPNEDDLPAPVVSTRPFTIPKIVGQQRLTVPPVAAGTHELDSSSELDLPQILELSNLDSRIDTVVASARPPGSARPDDVEVDLEDLHHEAAEAPPPAPTPPPASPTPAPEQPRAAPRTPPPRPRALPVPPPPPPREPSLLARAGVVVLAVACVGVWWSQFTREAEAGPPTVTRTLSLETWSEVHAFMQARRLDTDRTADYLKALAEAEAQRDPIGQAEAALCMHLRYGPDPVRSSAAEVWRRQAAPEDPRQARVAGLAALANDDVAEAERLLVGEDARSRLYRALAAQRRGDHTTAANEASAALALRPTDVAAGLVAVTSAIAARRTAPLDPLRAAAAAHSDHPLYREALVRALLDRGRLAEARTLADRIDRVNGASEAHQARALALKAEVAAAGGEISQAVWLFEKAGQLAPQDLPTQLARVRLLLSHGDRLRVQQELTQLARQSPDDPGVLALQAEAALKFENHAAATRAIDRLAAVDDERARVARLRGELNLKQGNVEAAIAAYRAAVDAQPDDVAALLALAGLRTRGSEGRAALAALDAARQTLQADPSAAQRPKLRALALGHANLLAETGRKDQAIGVLDAALAIDPDDNAAQLRRGELAIEQGRVAAGRADLAAVAERTGGYPGLVESLGRLYLRDNELVLLASLVQPHLADPRASDEVLVMGGLLRLAQGEVDAAEALIDRVLLRSGSVWEARLAKARVLHARGRPADALAEVRLARPPEPDAEVELWTGKILERLGKPQEAANAYRKARQLDPSLYEAAFLHGRALLAGGEAREAITELTAVTAATDAFPAAFLALGLAHRERGQYDLAINQFIRAALLDPSTGEAAYWAGRTRVELGRPADALYHLRRAVLAPSPGPWLADAHLWLARALIKQNLRDEAAGAYANYLKIAGPRAAARAEAEKLTRGR
ncbi:MAG: tetratricopeptide repeat protein [Myxococcales bacterium]|nr:tetratricopeptide repeat protein [Myxococcales bacterium]